MFNVISAVSITSSKFSSVSLNIWIINGYFYFVWGARIIYWHIPRSWNQSAWLNDVINHGATNAFLPMAFKSWQACLGLGDRISNLQSHPQVPIIYVIMPLSIDYLVNVHFHVTKYGQSKGFWKRTSERSAPKSNTNLLAAPVVHSQTINN